MLPCLQQAVSRLMGLTAHCLELEQNPRWVRFPQLSQEHPHFLRSDDVNLSTVRLHCLWQRQTSRNYTQTCKPVLRCLTCSSWLQQWCRMEHTADCAYAVQRACQLAG